MRQVNFEEVTGHNGLSFDFGNQSHRAVMVANNIAGRGSFTYGHYRVGDATITVGGAVCENNLYYSVSICSPEDNFSKKIGRKNVRDNFILSKRSVKRGVLDVSDIVDQPPAVLLRAAAVHYLGKTRGLPRWTKMEVKFRNNVD